jgi:membrane protein
VLWLVVSLLFKLYVAKFTDYNAAYGTIGGVIVLMLWFYLSGVAILAGAEVNAEIEHASPQGKGPGQKSATGRRVIGARARRLGDAPHESRDSEVSVVSLGVDREVRHEHQITPLNRSAIDVS